MKGWRIEGGWEGGRYRWLDQLTDEILNGKSKGK